MLASWRSGVGSGEQLRHRLPIRRLDRAFHDATLVPLVVEDHVGGQFWILIHTQRVELAFALLAFPEPISRLETAFGLLVEERL